MYMVCTFRTIYLYCPMLPDGKSASLLSAAVLLDSPAALATCCGIYVCHRNMCYIYVCLPTMSCAGVHRIRVRCRGGGQSNTGNFRFVQQRYSTPRRARQAPWQCVWLVGVLCLLGSVRRCAPWSAAFGVGVLAWLLTVMAALAACCGFDLCHKSILYLYLYLMVL